jgi:hypothetical protein
MVRLSASVLLTNILLMNLHRAQDMSQQFPHVDFLSVDNFPLTSHIPRPNVAFEVYDLYNGILATDASFDVVHVRHALLHVSPVAALGLQHALTTHS